MFFFTLAGNALSQEEGVYLKSGEYYEGEIVAIGTEIVLIKVNDRVFSVKRDEVKYVFNGGFTPNVYTVNGVPVERTRVGEDTLDRVYMIELAGGLYTFSNFAVSLQMIQWIKLYENWSAGLLTSLDLSRYFMTKFGVLGKYNFPFHELTRSYLIVGVGVGPWSSKILDDGNFGSSYEFSPIFQGSLGSGIWYDTGYKIAFTIEGGMAVTGFRLTEELIDGDGSNRSRQVTRALNLGPYFRGGIVF